MPAQLSNDTIIQQDLTVHAPELSWTTVDLSNGYMSSKGLCIGP